MLLWCMLLLVEATWQRDLFLCLPWTKRLIDDRRRPIYRKKRTRGGGKKKNLYVNLLHRTVLLYCYVNLAWPTTSKNAQQTETRRHHDNMLTSHDTQLHHIMTDMHVYFKSSFLFEFLRTKKKDLCWYVIVPLIPIGWRRFIRHHRPLGVLLYCSTNTI